MNLQELNFYNFIKIGSSISVSGGRHINEFHNTTVIIYDLQLF